MINYLKMEFQEITSYRNPIKLSFLLTNYERDMKITKLPQGNPKHKNFQSE